MYSNKAFVQVCFQLHVFGIVSHVSCHTNDIEICFDRKGGEGLPTFWPLSVMRLHGISSSGKCSRWQLPLKIENTCIRVVAQEALQGNTSREHPLTQLAHKHQMRLAVNWDWTNVEKHWQAIKHAQHATKHAHSSPPTHSGPRSRDVDALHVDAHTLLGVFQIRGYRFAKWLPRLVQSGRTTSDWGAGWGNAPAEMWLVLVSNIGGLLIGRFWLRQEKESSRGFHPRTSRFCLQLCSDL